MFSGGLGWGGGPNSLIKSAQYFEITIPAGDNFTSQAITQVDMTKSILILNGIRSDDDDLAHSEDIGVVAFDGDEEITVFTRSISASYARIFSVAVIEFQAWACEAYQNSLTVSSGQVASATESTGWTAADQENVILIFNGIDSTGPTDSLDRNRARLIRGNDGVNTTINARRTETAGSVTLIVYYSAIKFIPGVLDSVQYAVVQPLTAVGPTVYTIEEVDVSRSILLSGGFSSDGFQEAMPRVAISSPTSISLSTGANGRYPIASVFVLEFSEKWVKSRFSSEDTIPLGASTKSTAISQVDLNKTLVAMNGFTTTENSEEMGESYPTVYPESSTSIKSERALTSATVTTITSYNGIEFY